MKTWKQILIESQKLKLSQIKPGTKFINKNNYKITIKEVSHDKIIYDWLDMIGKNRGTEELTPKKFEQIIL